MDEFKDVFLRVAQGLVTHNSQNDVTVGELQRKYRSKFDFFETIKAVFGRKK